jgi:TPR repeat protein
MGSSNMANSADKLITAGALGSAWADWDDGVAAYAAGDYAMARRRWFPQAEQGDAKAQYNLGVIFANGKGVPKNEGEAIKWYSKAAEQGHAGGQFGLGAAYFLGLGVPENYVQAHMWLALAKAQGHEKAATGLDVVKAKLSRADIATARDLSSQWWRQHN